MDFKKFTAAAAWLALSLIFIIIASNWGWLKPPLKNTYNSGLNPVRDMINGVSPDLPPAPVNYQPRTDHLVAAWALNESEGNIAADNSGHGIDGYGAVWTSGGDCVNKSCALFDPYSSGSIAFNLPAVPRYTISGWINPFNTLGDEKQIFSSYSDGVGLTILDGSLLAFDGRMLFSPEQLQPHTIYHIAVTYDGQEKRMYINGDLVAKDTGNGGIYAGPAALGNHIDLSNRHFSGTLSDFRLFDEALPAEDIHALYTAR